MQLYRLHMSFVDTLSKKISETLGSEPKTKQGSRPPTVPERNTMYYYDSFQVCNCFREPKGWLIFGMCVLSVLSIGRE